MFINQNYLLFFSILFMFKFLWGKLSNGLIIITSFLTSVTQKPLVLLISPQYKSRQNKRTNYQ
jgi:hypothetical protein